MELPDSAGLADCQTLATLENPLSLGMSGFRELQLTDCLREEGAGVMVFEGPWVARCLQEGRLIWRPGAWC